MYGIVEISGHQYQVRPGRILDVQKLDVQEGATVDLDKVLFIGGEQPIVGLPEVAGAKIQAKVIRQARSRKLPILKRSPGKWQRTRGHRQSYTSLLITEIQDGKGNVNKIDVESKEYKKFMS